MADFNEINVALCKAVGLDPASCRDVTISLSPQRPPIVHAEIRVKRLDIDGSVETVLRRYELTEIATQQVADADAEAEIEPEG